jgi:hypothetical protein
LAAIIAALINVGFGGCVVAALIWFLRRLVTVTLPQQQQAFLEALDKERAERQGIVAGVAVTLSDKVAGVSAQQLTQHNANVETLHRIETTLVALREGGCSRGPFAPGQPWPGRNAGAPGPT